MLKKILLKSFLLLTPVFAHASIIVKDSLGEHHFTAIPQRIIALDWAATENLLELGIVPLAIADTGDYQRWVRVPALPKSMIDVGTRDAPNIERIAQLQPDVIIIGGHQQALLDKLQPIAPVLMFTNYSRKHHNPTVAKQHFLSLAALFQKQGLAQQRLDAQEDQLKRWRQHIARHFQGAPPPVVTVRFNNTALVWVYGDNAMPQYTLEQLGLQNAFPQPITQWGVTQKKIMELAAVENGVVLYFEPFEQKNQLFSSPLWQAMPFVRQQRVAALPSVWSYGGPLSVTTIAKAITEQLLAITPE